MPRYEARQPVDTDIEVGVGYVEVIASARADVVAEVTPTNAGRSGDVSLAADAIISFEAGRLRVVVPRRVNLFGQSDSVDVRVEIPEDSQVAIETAYGSARIRGRVGTARITAKYGNVSADTVGDLVLNAPYGEVDIAEVDGRLDATFGHGQARVNRISGDARVRGSHGTIDLGTTVGEVEVSTAGPLTIGRALGDVSARSAHGAIRVREVTGGSVRIENGYAEVEVGVPFGIAAWVDAASAHGAIRNELTPDVEAAAADRTVALRLRANWADVIIRRAGSTAAPRTTTAPRNGESA
jgi:hypothetical protein